MADWDSKRDEIAPVAGVMMELGSISIPCLSIYYAAVQSILEGSWMGLWGETKYKLFCSRFRNIMTIALRSSEARCNNISRNLRSPGFGSAPLLLLAQG